MDRDQEDRDTLYLGLIRQAVWGNLTMETGVIILTVTMVLFVVSQNFVLAVVTAGGLYLLGIALSLGDPFYLRILTIRFFKLRPSRTQAFWRGGRRYMP